ncbi:MAG: hypothetical protein Fur0025_36000 [Oscillatoriaceae cyanobacterium]
MTTFTQRLSNLSPKKRISTLEKLPSHLAATAQPQKLYKLLTNFEFIAAKITTLGVQALIEDYKLATNSLVQLSPEQTKNLQLISGALQLSAQIIAEDNTQLLAQLWGRLLSFDIPDIQTMLATAKPEPGKPWLRPMTANLTPPIGSLGHTLIGHNGSVNAVAISPDRQFAVSGSGDKTLKVWDLAQGKELHTLIGHNDSVNAVAISPDRQFAVSGSGDNTLKVWDLAQGQELYTLIGHNDSVNAVAISPDRQFAVSGSKDKTLKVWDLAQGKELYTLIGHDDSVNAVTISPDSKFAVSHSWDDIPIVWDLAKGQQLQTLQGYDGSVNAVAICPDRQFAVSGSWDNSLKVWELAYGKELHSLEGHNGSVNAVAISPDRQFAVSGSEDNTVKVWDLLTGEAVATFRGESEFNCCAVAVADEVVIVAGDKSGVVHLLQLEINPSLPPFIPLPQGAENPVILLFTSLFLLDYGREDEAFSCWEQAAQIRPDAAAVIRKKGSQLLYQRGNMFLKEKHYKFALKCFTRLVKLQSKKTSLLAYIRNIILSVWRPNKRDFSV